jgi:hypothetical protein
VDELMDLTDIDAAQAGSLIMAARASWFRDEQRD